MCDNISPQFYEILKPVVKGDIDNFEISIHDSNKKGEGFLGEVVYITLKDRYSELVYNLVVKQAFDDQRIRDAHPIRYAFVNEIHFYTQIWPRLNKFQQTIPQKYQFRKLPKCFASISDENSEKLVLENLKFQNFKVHDKKVPLDKGHYEVIMKEYGRFHALSFAYKVFHPEEYENLVKGQLDVYSVFAHEEGFCKGIKITTEMSMDSLQPDIDDVIIEKYRPYLEDGGVEMFLKSLDCSRKYSVITHGDCWSNNMMFKYDEDGEITDVRFLDFQLSREGSPCSDLAYTLYSGAPESVLQDFDHYLRIYHNSLSDTLKVLDCDPEKVYPFSVLKKEWKQYCKLGVIMGLMIWKMKCTYENSILDFTDDIPVEEQIELYKTGYDKERYSKICRNLLIHLHENDFL